MGKGLVLEGKGILVVKGILEGRGRVRMAGGWVLEGKRGVRDCLSDTKIASLKRSRNG